MQKKEKIKISEREILRSICDYLDILERQGKLWYFRAGSGAVQLSNGGYFKTGKKGCPDIVICTLGGKFFGLEVKTATGRQNDSQKAVEGQIKALGGRYEVVRSLDDVMNIKY